MDVKPNKKAILSAGAIIDEKQHQFDLENWLNEIKPMRYFRIDKSNANLK